MIIGAFERQRPQSALKRLGAPPGIARHLTTATQAVRLLAVAVIGVETLCDGPRRQPQGLLPNRRLQCFQIQIFQALAAQQRFDVPQDLSGEQAVERSFF